MARRKGLPPLNKTIANLGDRIEARKFSRSSAAEGDVDMTYVPTNTTWPGNNWDHRRTTEAGYNRDTGVLRIEFFTDGSLYDYGTAKPVPPSVARQFRRTASPGKFINSTLEAYGYERIR